MPPLGGEDSEHEELFEESAKRKKIAEDEDEDWKQSDDEVSDNEALQPTKNKT